MLSKAVLDDFLLRYFVMAMLDYTENRIERGDCVVIYRVATSTERVRTRYGIRMQLDTQ